MFGNSFVLEGSLCGQYYVGHYTICILESEGSFGFRPGILLLAIDSFQLRIYHYYNISTEYVWRNCLFYDSILHTACIV